MNLLEFYDAVEADDLIDGVDITTDAPGGSVKVKGPAGGFIFGLDAIAENDWATLRSVLIGGREPEALTHMTRIVGYFSRTSNWNKSKLGELRDRQKGDYGVKEEPCES